MCEGVVMDSSFDAAKSNVRPTRSVRDRHDRGLRGTLTPPRIPITTSRADDFDSMVIAAVERIQGRFPELADVGIEVEEVPRGPRRDGTPDPIMLGMVNRPPDGEDGSIVIFRFPIELRAKPGPAREKLVTEVCTELVAEYYGLSLVDVNPDYDSRE